MLKFWWKFLSNLTIPMMPKVPKTHCMVDFLADEWWIVTFMIKTSSIMVIYQDRTKQTLLKFSLFCCLQKDYCFSVLSMKLMNSTYKYIYRWSISTPVSIKVFAKLITNKTRIQTNCTEYSLSFLAVHQIPNESSKLNKLNFCIFKK